LLGRLRENYFFAGAAGTVGVAVEVTVDVTADAVAGAEAFCCWHPTTKNAATARTAMIAEIFFMVFPPFLGN
jgi:hypothetical protein